MMSRMLNKIGKGKNKLGVEIVTQLYIMGKTQTWLAQQCNVSKQYISLVIHGKSKPSSEVSQKIAEVLNMDVKKIRKLALEVA